MNFSIWRLKHSCIIRDGLLSEHLAHVGAAGRVADHRRAVADEGDGLIARHLQALIRHRAMKWPTCRESAVQSADIERGLPLSIISRIVLIFVTCAMRPRATSLVIKFHNYLLFCRQTPSVHWTEGRKTTRYQFVIPGASQRRAWGAATPARYRAHLSGPTAGSGRPPEGISPCFPAALHRPAALCAWSTGALHSITAFYYGYPNRKPVLCQVRLSNISAARSAAWVDARAADDAGQSACAPQTERRHARERAPSCSAS